MENQYVVYLLWDPRNGDVRYVGLTHNPQTRFGQHRRGTNAAGYCRNWEWSLIREGLSCEWAIVEDGLTLDDANEKEKWWIAYGRQCNWPLTNITDGGDGAPGHSPSLELRERISKKLQGHPVTDKVRESIRQRNLGNKHSPETIAKCVLSRSWYKHSPETKARIGAGNRIALTGRKCSPEHIEATRRANLGHGVSPETRGKIGAANRGRKKSSETVTRWRESMATYWARKKQLKGGNDVP